jgi:NitT/TauT family transport system substrate-binding protein
VRFKSVLSVASVCVAVSLVASGGAWAQQLDKVRAARLAFPAMGSMLLDVITEKGIDKKHGFIVESVSQNAVPVYYGMAANGDADIIVGGPNVFQKMILEGVPVKIFATWAPMQMISVISSDPSVKTLADLKGKSLAAAVGSAEYQVTAMYGRHLGLNFGKDVQVISAAPPLARSQLEADRVQASMLWEPTTTMALRDNPKFHVIMAGDAAWKAVAGRTGYNLVLAARDDYLKKNEKILPRLIAMLQEGQKFALENVDETDAILQRTLKMPAGVYKDAVKSGRLTFDVRPTTGPIRDTIWDMFKIAVDTKYLPKLPPEDAIYPAK